MSGKKAQSPVRKCNWQLHYWGFIQRAGRVARRDTAERINHTCTGLFRDLVSRVTGPGAPGPPQVSMDRLHVCFESR